MSNEAVDREVEELYRRADADPCAPPGTGALAYRLFSRARTHLLPHGARAEDITIRRLGGVWCLFLANVASADAQMPLARAIASWHCKTARRSVPIDQFTRAIVIPTPALRIMREILHYRDEELPAVFKAPAAVVMMRVREVFGGSSSGEYVLAASKKGGPRT